jgi:methylmalonyl-CoA carboxyltransferase large subunit
MREGETGNIEMLLAEIRGELAALAERVSRLEHDRGAEPLAAHQRGAEATRERTGLVGGIRNGPANRGACPTTPISEDRLVAISAAVAAFLGERVRIRQIRLIRSNAWAQQGRVSVQASHWLHR